MVVVVLLDVNNILKDFVVLFHQWRLFSAGLRSPKGRGQPVHGRQGVISSVKYGAPAVVASVLFGASSLVLSAFDDAGKAILVVDVRKRLQVILDGEGWHNALVRKGATDFLMCYWWWHDESGGI